MHNEELNWTPCNFIIKASILLRFLKISFLVEIEPFLKHLYFQKSWNLFSACFHNDPLV